MMFPENITIEEVREVIAKQNSVSDFATFVESDKGEYIVFLILCLRFFRMRIRAMGRFCVNVVD